MTARGTFVPLHSTLQCTCSHLPTVTTSYQQAFIYGVAIE